MGTVHVVLLRMRTPNVLVKNLGSKQNWASAIVVYTIKSNMKFKTFEIFDSLETRVFNALDKPSIPPKEHIDAMLKNGYKIKIDGKLTTKKTINELIK